MAGEHGSGYRILCRQNNASRADVTVETQLAASLADASHFVAAPEALRATLLQSPRPLAYVCPLRWQQHPFFQMPSHVRVGCGVRIVRHHHYRLVKVFIQSLEDLQHFGVSEEDLRTGRRGEAFLRLMRFEAERARGYYNDSRLLLDLIHPRSRASLWALISIYSRLLERIEASNYDVFRRRVRLPLWEKSWIVWRALVG